MTQERLPHLPLYTQDWLASGTIAAMTIEAEGCYLRLLQYQWQDGVLPKDMRKLAARCRLAHDVARFESEIWPQLAECFEEHEDGYRNPRIDRERNQAEEKVEAKRQAGKKGRAAQLTGEGRASAEQPPTIPKKEAQSVPDGSPGNRREEAEHASSGAQATAGQPPDNRQRVPGHTDTEVSTANAVGESAVADPPRPSERARSEPFDSVFEFLTGLSERIEGMPPPKRQEVARHCAESSPLRLLVETYGVAKLIDLAAWAYGNDPKALNWSTMLNQHRVIHARMVAANAGRASTAGRPAERSMEETFAAMTGRTGGV